MLLILVRVRTHPPDLTAELVRAAFTAAASPGDRLEHLSVRPDGHHWVVGLWLQHPDPVAQRRATALVRRVLAGLPATSWSFEECPARLPGQHLGADPSDPR